MSAGRTRESDFFLPLLHLYAIISVLSLNVTVHNSTSPSQFCFLSYIQLPIYITFNCGEHDEQQRPRGT